MKRKAVKTNGNRLMRVCGALLVMYILFAGVFKLLRMSGNGTHKDTTANRVQIESLLYATDIGTFDLAKKIDHNRCWNQLRTKEELCLSYSLLFAETYKSTDFKNKIDRFILPKQTDYIGIWKTIYGSLYQRDPEAIRHIADSLQQIGVRKNMTRTQFARAVVSFVQDIPYWYILPDDNCSENKDKSFPCIDNIQFGLLTPTEVAYTAIGDCDSKSLLLYSLLRTLGYKPMILISREYRHAMLALDIPSSGDYVKYKGSLYYFWETTATGWQSGMLPPTTSNKNYWEIALPPDFRPGNTYKII